LAVISGTIRAMGQIRSRETRAGRPQLDDTSKAIIEQLQQDGRRAYATIGKAVGLSEAAVRQRVQKLIESGVVQIVAVTDPQQIGFARQVMIGINVEGDVEGAAEALCDIPELVYVVITAGSFDLLCEAVVIDDEHLLELINDRIRKLPGVRRTETFMYLKLKKQTYNWGIA
jgi:Lrp/AsnC family transcriptional regulator for asnA, asnC and gidA